MQIVIGIDEFIRPKHQRFFLVERLTLSKMKNDRLIILKTITMSSYWKCHKEFQMNLYTLYILPLLSSYVSLFCQFERNEIMVYVNGYAAW